MTPLRIAGIIDMQNIFISELLDPGRMRAFNGSYGIELIRFPISDELNSQQQAEVK